MRFQSRPGYLAHRAFHRGLIRFQVWRNNRSVAEAFRDADACDVIYRRRGAAQARILKGLLIVALASASALVWHHQRTGNWDWRQGASEVKATASEILSAPLGSRHMSGPASPSANPVTAQQVALGSLAPAPALTSASLPSAASTPAPAPASAPTAKVAAPSAVAPEPSGPARFPAQANVLLACKKDRTLYAYVRKAGTWSRIAAFPMAIGRNAGDKDERGDARTPEGQFWITGMVAGPSKGPLYGALVFPLNYPRPSDRAEGKGGDGIWIHGVPAGTLPNFTHGCISLANDDILALANLATAGTPVVILSDSVGPDPARQIDTVGLEREYPGIAEKYVRKTAADSAAREKALKEARAFVANEQKHFPDLAMQSLTEADRKAILARLDKWRADWSNRALDAYATNYDASFRDRHGRPKDVFLERKAHIFESKSKIEMELRDPKIEPECYGRVRVSFRQDYLAEGADGAQRSSETKTLRLDQGPQGWLIITE
ncbi:MAG: L,D-transpeptidase [Fibrobacteres bacterium]|nr:L,D-transpeptidase [Fibrobacterota bacterium]